MSESRVRSLRNAFLAGLLLVAPLVVTAWALRIVIGFVGGSITPLFLPYLPESLRHLSLLWDVLATIIVLGLVTALGYFSRYMFGQFFGAMAERFIESIPGIGGFYVSVKQFFETFGAKNRTQFSKVVLVQYPHPGAYTLGFITNTGRGEPHQHFNEDRWAVFVPTCPSPVNGFFLFVPAKDIIELDMSVGDGMKTVISCGAVLPNGPDAETAKQALPGGNSKGQ
jgi:uncharacterized membrane protein